MATQASKQIMRFAKPCHCKKRLKLTSICVCASLEKIWQGLHQFILYHSWIDIGVCFLWRNYYKIMGLTVYNDVVTHIIWYHISYLGQFQNTLGLEESSQAENTSINHVKYDCWILNFLKFFMLSKVLRCRAKIVHTQKRPFLFSHKFSAFFERRKM